MSEINRVGILYRLKVQAFLSWFSRKPLLRTETVIGPADKDFIGNGPDYATPIELTEGAVSRSANAGPLPRGLAHLARRGTRRTRKLSHIARIVRTP
jgi:hypothetical protein